MGAGSNPGGTSSSAAYDNLRNTLQWAYTSGDGQGITYTLEGGDNVGFTAEDGYVIHIRNVVEKLEYTSTLQVIPNISKFLQETPEGNLGGRGYGGIYWTWNSYGNITNWDNWTTSFVVYQWPATT